MYSLDRSLCPRLAGTGNRRALSLLLVPLPPWPATAAVSSALPPIYTRRQPPAADTRGLHPPPSAACAQPGRQTLSRTALGLSAVPTGGVRPQTRGEPVAAQGILLPPMAADARRALHGGVRSLRRTDRPDSGSFRPRRARDRSHTGRRR